MCLATAYLKNEASTSVLAKNISNIKIDGNSVVLTDILGAELVVPGRLITADLVNGVVEILAA